MDTTTHNMTNWGTIDVDEIDHLSYMYIHNYKLKQEALEKHKCTSRWTNWNDL